MKPTREEIGLAAKEASLYGENPEMAGASITERVERFYTMAYRKGMLRAAEICQARYNERMELEAIELRNEIQAEAEKL